MSTILDALKKSEQERKQNEVPKLTDMPPPQESARWPLFVIAILSLLLALVLGVLISRWFTPVATSVGDASSSETIQASSSSSPSMGEPGTAENQGALEIVVNVVSYSTDPSQRFVILDGKLYRENDFVRAGLKVEEIKANMVVLNSRGQLITKSP